MNLGELIIMGTVGAIDTRTGVKDGKSWTMTYALIPSIYQTFRVLLNDDLVGAVQKGDDVSLSVYTEVYQNKASYRATGFFDGAGAARFADVASV